MTNRDRVIEIVEVWRNDMSRAYEQGLPTPDVGDLILADRLAAEGLIAPEWIQVSERLPEKGSHVMVVRPETQTTVRKIHFIIWSDGDEDDFSQWMPAPDFPPPPQADTVQEPRAGSLTIEDQIRLYMKSGGTKGGAEKLRTKLMAEEKQNAQG